MLLAEMPVGALTPSANKVVIQSGADQRTYHWNQASCPLLDEFRAGLRGDLFDDARYQAVHYILFQKLAAQVHPSSTGGGNPEFRCLLVGVVFEAIEQTELLNGAQRDA